MEYIEQKHIILFFSSKRAHSPAAHWRVARVNRAPGSPAVHVGLSWPWSRVVVWATTTTSVVARCVDRSKKNQQNINKLVQFLNFYNYGLLKIDKSLPVWIASAVSARGHGAAAVPHRCHSAIVIVARCVIDVAILREIVGTSVVHRSWCGCSVVCFVVVTWKLAIFCNFFLTNEQQTHKSQATKYHHHTITVVVSPEIVSAVLGGAIVSCRRGGVANGSAARPIAAAAAAAHRRRSRITTTTHRRVAHVLSVGVAIRVATAARCVVVATAEIAATAIPIVVVAAGNPTGGLPVIPELNWQNTWSKKKN